jgi:8-oxo-dGTP diphosphatase
MNGQNKIKKAARVVFFDADENVPIIDVRNGEYYKIPGGGIEENETAEQAARREALEESGCAVEILQKIGEHEFADPKPGADIIHHSVCFLAKLINKGETKFDEWEQSNDFKLRWVSFGEAVRLFESSKTEDKYGQEINARDLDFLKKAKEIANNR